MLKFFLFAASTLIATSCASSPPCAPPLRAAFDIGSGTTKMKVYRYNSCAKNAAASLEEIKGPNCSGNRKNSYGEDVEKLGKIGEQTFHKGLAALRELKGMATKCGAREFSGVATSAFRRASNGPSVTARLGQTADIPVNIASREQEALLGFHGAALKLGTAQTNNHDENKICVWDIGGGSMQMTCSGKAQRHKMYLGNLASIPFKNAIIKLQKRQGPTPNPISESDYRRALEIAKLEAAKILSALGNIFQDSTVAGIGGVHYYAVSKALGKREYTADDLNSALSDRLNKTDRELGGDEYVTTAVSNLILVEGMMRGLNIHSVRALKVDLTEGLAADEDYWPPKR